MLRFIVRTFRICAVKFANCTSSIFARLVCDIGNALGTASTIISEC